MLRWLLLLATLIRTASSTRSFWCTGEKHEAIDHMPAFSTREERELMLLQQEVAATEARALARSRGKGPLVTQRLVEQAKIKVRDEAHDRAHARLLAELGQEQGAVEEVPLPATVAQALKRMEQKQ